MPEESTYPLEQQFDDPVQQEETSTTGMWVFLATEVLFFGGLFLAYIVYRVTYPLDFNQGVKLTDHLLGSMDTAVLLASSFTMALAVRAIQDGRQKLLLGLLVLTMVLGMGFLSMKGLEYSEHVSDQLLPGAHFKPTLSPRVEMFFVLYFLMTGLHTLHMTIGVGILGVISWKAWKGKYSQGYYNPVEVSGLYWSFVDIVWIFLYPLFYVIHWKGGP